MWPEIWDNSDSVSLSCLKLNRMNKFHFSHSPTMLFYQGLEELSACQGSHLSFRCIAGSSLKRTLQRFPLRGNYSINTPQLFLLPTQAISSIALFFLLCIRVHHSGYFWLRHCEKSGVSITMRRSKFLSWNGVYVTCPSGRAPSSVINHVLVLWWGPQRSPAHPTS